MTPTAGNGVRQKETGRGTDPQGHGRAPGPRVTAGTGGADPLSWPQAGQGGVLRGAREVRSRGTVAGEAQGRRRPHLGREERKAAASRASAAAAAAAAMSPGPRHGRRQMFPSNAPAQSAAQAPCVFRACAQG